MRLYYTCAIQAAYMAKHFGVRFDDDNFKKGEEWAEGNILYFQQLRYYIAPESEAIFEPKLKDIAKSNSSEEVGEIVSKSPYEQRVALARADDENCFIFRDSEISIIMRDNKQFFAPEKDQ